MNSFLNIIVLYFFTFFVVFISAQELPPINNYSPKLYGAENQNWAISQSYEKYIYIANNSGLLEFNGAKWNLYDSPNSSILRSVNVIGDKIYTGCYREFGFWSKNEFGSLEYNSLSNKIKDSILEDEQFWNIIEYDDWILFQSLHRIYIYNTIDGSYNVFSSKTQLPKAFKVKNSIYFQKMEEGLFKIENGEEVLISNHPILKNNILVNLFEVENKILLQTQENGFYFLNEEKITKWDINANNILSSISVYSSLKLKDGSFILGTISDGVYQLDNSGNIINHINQEKGLNNNTILSLFEDEDNNIWLGLDNGISVINLDSSFMFFNDINGKIGAVYASSIFNNYLYLGTNQGLFYKKVNSNESFDFVEGTEGQVWCLKEIENTLFCGHNSGTFVINKNTAELVTDVMGTWDIKPIKNNYNLLLQGHYNGFNIIEKINDKWYYRNELDGFNISSRFFEFTSDDELLVNHEYRGVFKLKFDKNYTKIIKFTTEKSVSKGLKSSLVKYINNVYYISDKGIFKYDYENGIFDNDSILTNKFLENDEYVSGKIILDNATNTLWGFTENNIVYFSPGKLNNVLKVDKISFPASSRRDISGYESMSRLDHQLYLFGTSKGYIIMDLDKINNKDFRVNINSFKKSSINSPLKEVSLSKENEFKAKDNNIYFEYSVPRFNTYDDIEYKYQLEGIYDKWSDWSSKSEVSFKNLPFGNYSFKVNAKIGNMLSNNTASYSFSIDRPWYLSNISLNGYLLLFILMVILINRAYRKYYNKQHVLKQSANEELIVRIKNEKLKQDIESKNRELAISTMSIIKKNEVLSSIKKELKNISCEPKEASPIIKLIDRNINNTKDWQFFEEAFNNADKHFLDKVKNAHPNLSPNDLRFCAYLRLNLSSKEIAPLLNISVRSVEIKRYRLRKKMKLAHHENLISHILEI